MEQWKKKQKTNERTLTSEYYNTQLSNDFRWTFEGYEIQERLFSFFFKYMEISIFIVVPEKKTLHTNTIYFVVIRNKLVIT